MSPIGKMEHQEFGPPWLIPMLKADYFITCRFHGDANKSECNLYCLDCCGNSLCSYCLTHHKDHRIVQVNLLKKIHVHYLFDEMLDRMLH